MKPIIGITIGDQAGIGSEIIEKAMPFILDVCQPRIIGERLPKEKIVYGQVSAECGRMAGEAIKEAVRLAQAKKIDAIVTAPINKEALNLGGFNYPGHTEMLAELTNTANYAMMLVHGNLRVVHATTHIPLKKVFEKLNTDLILEKIAIAGKTCRGMGISNPHIAVAALNPHGSDDGLFGNEEKEIIQPAIDKALLIGYRIEFKPIPADIVFAKALGGAYDCVIAMYHDQGHIPLKTIGFEWKGNEWGKIDGVNITCGLPIIRTSPDHGVAFGKAGKGIADPTSMVSAIKLAIKLAEAKNG